MKRILKTASYSETKLTFELPENCAGIYVNRCEIGGGDLRLIGGGTKRRNKLRVYDLVAGYGINFNSPETEGILVLTFDELTSSGNEASGFTMDRIVEIIAIEPGETFSPPREVMCARIYPVHPVMTFSGGMINYRAVSTTRPPVQRTAGPAYIAVASADKDVDIDLNYHMGASTKIPLALGKELGVKVTELTGGWPSGCASIKVHNRSLLEQDIAVIAVIS